MDNRFVLGQVGRSRGRAWRAATVLVLLLVGCDAQTGERPPDDVSAPMAELGFTQLLPREGTRHALLRVTNTGDSALDVTSVAIEWPGYPEGTPSPADPTIPVETAQGTVRHKLAHRDDVRTPPLAHPVRGRRRAQCRGDLPLQRLAGRGRGRRRPHTAAEAATEALDVACLARD